MQIADVAETQRVFEGDWGILTCFPDFKEFVGPTEGLDIITQRVREVNPLREEPSGSVGTEMHIIIVNLWL